MWKIRALPADGVDVDRVDVAVVGAGASGLLTVAQLARGADREGRRLRIALIDPASATSVGRASYATYVRCGRCTATDRRAQ